MWWSPRVSPSDLYLYLLFRPIQDGTHNHPYEPLECLIASVGKSVYRTITSARQAWKVTRPYASRIYYCARRSRNGQDQLLRRSASVLAFLVYL
jgi:hypothetical protein